MNILLLLLITCCCFSASLGFPSKHTRQTPDSGNLDDFVFPDWDITNFNAGCSPGGCIFTFNISSAATPSEPGITASCNINGDDIHWQQCDSTPSANLKDDTVWAMPFSSVETFELSIQHRFVNDSVMPTRSYNITGNMTVDFEIVSMPASFTVMGALVSEAWWWLKVRSVEEGGGGRDCVGHNRHACGPVRNADGSIRGLMHLESEKRSFRKSI